MSRTFILRVLYTILYSFLCLVLLALLLVTPVDLINQARYRNNGYPILIVAACYLASVLFVIFVYAARLYITRSVLNAIPRAWIPLDASDIHSKPVRRAIAAGLARSAAVAWAARPHADDGDEGEDDGRSPWGPIEHAGWAPGAGDALQYSRVVAELPSLIEARVLTQAVAQTQTQTQVPTKAQHATAVALLQRPATMGLRDYLGHLASLGVLSDLGDNNGDEERPLGAVISSFASHYEAARFSTQMLSYTVFRQLMHDLAILLQRMAPLDLAQLEGDSDDDSGGDYDDERSSLGSSTGRDSMHGSRCSEGVGTVVGR